MFCADPAPRIALTAAVTCAAVVVSNGRCRMLLSPTSTPSPSASRISTGAVTVEGLGLGAGLGVGTAEGDAAALGEAGGEDAETALLLLDPAQPVATSSSPSRTVSSRRVVRVSTAAP